jgi:hypothetical protein
MRGPSAKLRNRPDSTAELELELREAVADISRGDCVVLTPEQLATWAETGELPWPDESRD